LLGRMTTGAMRSASGYLDREHEIVFARLNRVWTRESDHPRRPFQLDDNMVRACRRPLSFVAPRVGRERKAAVLVDVGQGLDLRVGRRLELNLAVRHRLPPLENHLALDGVGPW